MSDPLKNRKEWTLVGHFGVDSGLCWIGDPCYVIHTPPDQSLGASWREFCDKLGDIYPTAKSFDISSGYEGLGCCISTGCGDGVYPVYALIRELPGWVGRRVVSVYVDFEGYGEEEDDD